MFNKTHVFAKNIKIGSVVSIYGEDWLCCGSIKIYDGEFDIYRIMLSSVQNPNYVYTFVHPTHQFSFYPDSKSYFDCEEVPF